VLLIDEEEVDDGEVEDEDVDDGEVDDDDVDDGEVDDGDVLDGYELLGVDEGDEDDGLLDGEELCANAPQHMPAAQRSVMILVL